MKTPSIDKSNYREYWKMIRGVAKEKTNQKLGFSVRILAMGIGVLSTTIVSIVLGSDPMSTLTAAIVTITVNLVVWLLVWLGFFVYYRAHQPVITNNEKDDEIRYFRNTLEKIENSKKKCEAVY